VYQDGDIRWAPGAKDGVHLLHLDDGGGADETDRIAALVQQISQKNESSPKDELYQILLEDNLMDFVDQVLEKIVALKISIQPYLYDYTKSLAFESLDRGPVKFGIVLLGLIQNQDDIDNVIMLGRHDEFTIFSAVAMTNMIENPEEKLWELAKYVEGWGRIHIVDRLADTLNPDIMRWLVREGYDNKVISRRRHYCSAHQWRSRRGYQ